MLPSPERAPVSVVIPTFDSGRFVTQAIDSVLAQTLPPSQIIVIDDGSRDDTHERLVPYAEHVLYVRQENQGVSAARNHGIRQATSEFVAFLDADDVWHPCKLELQMGALSRSPDLGLLGTHSFDWPAVAFPDVPRSAHGPLRFVDWQDLVVKNHLWTSSVVVRRRVLLQAGPFDTKMQGPEDRDLWLRIAECAGVANLELPLMGYRDVPGSVSKRAETCYRSMRRILHKLDERKMWRGRWLLRRKAYSYVYHSCSLLYDAAGARGTALTSGLKSFAWYPLPYRRNEVQVSVERVKRFLVIWLRLLGLKPPVSPPEAILQHGRADALETLKAAQSEAANAGSVVVPLP